MWNRTGPGDSLSLGNTALRKVYSDISGSSPNVSLFDKPEIGQSICLICKLLLAKSVYEAGCIYNLPLDRTDWKVHQEIQEMSLNGVSVQTSPTLDAPGTR